MLTPALALLAAALQIHVSPELACPSPDGLKAALAGLLPAAGDSRGEPGAAWLSRDRESLLVRVVDSRGRLLSERRLEPGDTPAERCPERTAEVAVIVAAAMATLRGPGTAGPPDDRPSSATATEALLSIEPESPKGSSSRVEIALHLGASLAGSTAVPAVAVGIAHVAKSWLTVGVGALYSGERTQRVDVGQADWSRFAGEANATCRGSLVGRLWIAGGVAGLAGVRVINGRAFPQTHRSLTFDPGVALNLRIGAMGERVGFWAGAMLLYWPRTQGVYVQGSDQTADLPALELMLSVGMTFSLGVISSGNPT